MATFNAICITILVLRHSIKWNILKKRKIVNALNMIPCTHYSDIPFLFSAFVIVTPLALYHPGNDNGQSVIPESIGPLHWSHDKLTGANSLAPPSMQIS